MMDGKAREGGMTTPLRPPHTNRATLQVAVAQFALPLRRSGLGVLLAWLL